MKVWVEGGGARPPSAPRVHPCEENTEGDMFQGDLSNDESSIMFDYDY